MPKLTVTVDLTNEAARWLLFYADMSDITVDDLVSDIVNSAVNLQINGDGTPPKTIEDDDIPF